MKLLFILDRLPYPPRNGVTIPTFNLISRLSKKHEISMLYVKDISLEIDKDQLLKNKEYVEKLWIVERIHNHIFYRMIDELFKIKPLFLGWIIDKDKIKKYLKGYSFDIILGSPLKVMEAMESAFEILERKPVQIIGINDCYTNVLRSMGKRFFMKGISPYIRFKYLINWMRSYLIAPIEAKLLDRYQLALVQTNLEKKWLDRISKGKLNEKVMVFPNGVNDKLFQIPIECKRKKLLFFGSLRGGYAKVIDWIIKNVWPKIKIKLPDTEFHIIGRPINRKLQKQISSDVNIIYNEFVEDICDVFRNIAVSIAPVFKGYGLINKVIESMAAGVPVVGDTGSFTGISGFVDGLHGVIAEDEEDMAESIIDLLKNQEKRIEIAINARKLVKDDFSWDDRIKSLEEKFNTFNL